MSGGTAWFPPSGFFHVTGREKLLLDAPAGKNQAVRRSIHARVFKSVSAIFLARWSRVPMDLGMPMCRRLLIQAYGTSVLCRDGQGNDELGRMAVGRDEQVLLREPERFQAVFHNDLRLVFPYFRGAHARRDGLSARQPGKFAHQPGAKGAGAVAPAPLDGAGAHMAGGEQGAFVHAFRFKAAHQVVKVLLAAVVRVVAAKADEAALRMNPLGAFWRGASSHAGRLVHLQPERNVWRRARPDRAGFRWI